MSFSPRFESVAIVHFNHFVSFSKREGQKIAVAEASAQSAAEARLLKTKRDLEQRAEALKEEAASEELQARLIEYSLTAVDEGNSRSFSDALDLRFTLPDSAAGGQFCVGHWDELG